ncbi:MAG: FecR family protein, partial [Methyloceanibacter sp.]
MRAKSSALCRRLPGGSVIALLGIVLGVSLATGPADANKVGVAAAVNPDAFSSLSGAPQSQLNIGKSIFYNERIKTTDSGLVQVLLVDGSTFTVGPGSELVIDKFVYNPKKQTGQVVATFSKGVVRYVGGKISKNDAGVTVKTPAGALAIRGGMFQGTVNGNKGIFSFLYGAEMVFTGKNGQVYTVYQPGYTLDLTTGTPVVRPTTAADINSVMTALTNGNTGGTGASDEGSQASQQILAETISLQDLISDAAGDRMTDTIAEERNRPDETTVIDTPTPSDIPTDTPTDTSPAPPPPTITARVLAAPGVYTAFGNTTIHDPASNGILGGGDYGGAEGPFADDFVWTFNIVNNRLVGTVSGLLDANCGSGPNCQPIETHPITAALVDFPATFVAAQCENGLCPVVDAKITQNGVTTTLIGNAVLKPDFFAYHLAENHGGELGDPLLIFGGKAHKFDAPSGKVHLFQLSADVLQVDAFGPFASSDSTPQSGIGANSPLMLLEQDQGGAEDPSKAVWLQTSFIVGTGESQGQSFVNIALGEWSVNSGLTGARRGGSDVDDAYSFSGDIASLAGPDEGHFLGSENPNLVVGFDSTGTHNIGRDTPLNENNADIQDQSGSTYHIGVGTGSLDDLQQTGGTFTGYAAGFAQQPGHGAPRTLLNTSPSGVSIVLDAETNTMTAS